MSNGTHEKVDRFVRQQSLVPMGRLQELMISVIGVGAIGRQSALQLASIGAKHIQLIDPDVVEATNITTQGYTVAELGSAKVDSTSQAIRSIDAKIDVKRIVDVYRPRYQVGEVVFCCVDSISARSAIWRSAGSMDRKRYNDVQAALCRTYSPRKSRFNTYFSECEKVALGVGPGC